MQNRIKEYRQRANLTQAKLAERSGISRATVWQIEHGKVIPCMDTAYRICDVLKAGIEDVFIRSEY